MILFCGEPSENMKYTNLFCKINKQEDEKILQI